MDLLQYGPLVEQDPKVIYEYSYTNLVTISDVLGSNKLIFFLVFKIAPYPIRPMSI